MKNIMNIVAATVFAGSCFTGCSSMPDDAKVYATAYATGVAAATIADKAGISANAASAAAQTLEAMQQCIPGTNETFAAKWQPIAAEHIKKLVAAGKISVAEGVLVEQLFVPICSGLDYVVDVRWPSVGQHTELVSAAVHGFSDGFLKSFSSGDALKAVAPDAKLDEEELQLALKHLRAKLKSVK